MIIKSAFWILLLLLNVSAFPRMNEACKTNLQQSLRPKLKYPLLNQMPRGGQCKTTTGELKTLVVFIRFADDTINTPTWPDYHVLPDWAQKFVNPTVPADGKYYQYSLSDYFDRCSGGDGNGIMGQFKIIGDVYYVTTLQPRSKYKYDGDVESEVIKTLDDSNGVYKINFKN